MSDDIAELKQRIEHLERLVLRLEVHVVGSNSGLRLDHLGIKSVSIDREEYESWFRDVRARAERVMAGQAAQAGAGHEGAAPQTEPSR